MMSKRTRPLAILFVSLGISTLVACGSGSNSAADAGFDAQAASDAAFDGAGPTDAAAFDAAPFDAAPADAAPTDHTYFKSFNNYLGFSGIEFSVVAISGDTLVVGAPKEDGASSGMDGDQTPSSAANDSGAVYVFRRTGFLWAEEAYIKASNPALGDHFGGKVALDGDTLAVTSQEADGARGSVYVFRRTGASWAEEDRLVAANAGPLDRFGFSISLDGDTLAVGAALEDSSLTGLNGSPDNNDALNAGAVYIFRRNGSGDWSQEAYIKSSDAIARELFGVTLSLDGDRLAVGATGESAVESGAGAVYVFSRTGTTWAQTHRFRAESPQEDGNFGFPLAVHGDTLVAGIDDHTDSVGINNYQNNENAFDSGAVLVYRLVSNVWVQEAYIKSSNSEQEDEFGGSIALQQDTLLVSAGLESSNSTGANGDQQDNDAVGSGAVYRFRRVGQTWTQDLYLKAPNSEADDGFGASLSLDENGRIATSSPGEDSSALGVNGDQTNNDRPGSGAVYLYPVLSEN